MDIADSSAFVNLSGGFLVYIRLVNSRIRCRSMWLSNKMRYCEFSTMSVAGHLCGNKFWSRRITLVYIVMSSSGKDGDNPGVDLYLNH